MLSIVAITVLLALPSAASASFRSHQPEDDNDGAYVEAEVVPEVPVQAPVSSLATNMHHHKFGHHASAAPAPAAPAGVADPAEQSAHEAKEAAGVAKQAAKVANRVAEHSMKVTGHAKKALKHALGALHDARVKSEGMEDGQKESLKKAEARLREATKKAEYGELHKGKGQRDAQKEKMEKDLDKKDGSKTEKEELIQEIQDLRKKLHEDKADDKDIDKALDDLEADVEKSDGSSNDEIKAELEQLREQIKKLDDKEKEEEKEKKDEHHDKHAADEKEADATPVQDKGIDIDTAMPYGDLEPFGREDTAQELTEGAIHESDEMVDQLERAEVAEEKRAVFRALTRLRGAAITSFDGVARAQTGNIDEYSKTHKWRGGHPLHHLADEEADVTKWAFPENADFLQKKP